jgi:hydrogenase expression/formation protein HypC
MKALNLQPSGIYDSQGNKLMCLAIPSKIVKIENNVATIDVDGVRREASLLILENPKVGDYVIVHAGFAIHKINEEDAMESLRLIREAVSLIFDNDKQK